MRSVRQVANSVAGILEMYRWCSDGVEDYYHVAARDIVDMWDMLHFDRKWMNTPDMVQIGMYAIVVHNA